MVSVDKLISAAGNARNILGLRHAGVVEWCDSTELARCEVVRGVQFDAFAVSKSEVGLDFVKCEFRQCVFKDLTTDGHLWSAEDRWSDCIFEQCNLRRMIAPVNTFERCRFENVSVVNFRPHQTLFSDCSFSGFTIEGLKSHLISNSQIRNRDLISHEGQLFFQNCRFTGVSFRQSYFRGVVFRGCSFESTESSGCDFDGVISDVAWWTVQKIDPFSVFLCKALDLIRLKCGLDSAAYREFESYMTDYSSGRTSSKDFSACLYNDRVPYADTQRIITDLRKLVATFPF